MILKSIYDYILTWREDVVRYVNLFHSIFGETVCFPSKFGKECSETEYYQ